jgi:hypothetical protein
MLDRRRALESEAEKQHRLKMTDSEVADDIERLMPILLPTEAPSAEKAREYAEAWVDAGYIITMHGIAIVAALRRSAEALK